MDVKEIIDKAFEESKALNQALGALRFQNAVLKWAEANKDALVRADLLNSLTDVMKADVLSSGR